MAWFLVFMTKMPYYQKKRVVPDPRICKIALEIFSGLHPYCDLTMLQKCGQTSMNLYEIVVYFISWWNFVFYYEEYCKGWCNAWGKIILEYLDLNMFQLIFNSTMKYLTSFLKISVTDFRDPPDLKRRLCNTKCSEIDFLL